jgi:CrcB protein
MAVNMTGCFLIGLFDSLAGEKFLLGPQARLLLMTAFCGAFTTFSTLILETSNLMKDGELWLAFVNSLGSLAFGLLLFRLGVWLGKAV